MRRSADTANGFYVYIAHSTDHQPIYLAYWEAEENTRDTGVLLQTIARPVLKVNEPVEEAMCELRHVQ